MPVIGMFGSMSWTIVANGCGERGGVAAGGHDQRAAQAEVLALSQIQPRRRRLSDPVVLGVRRDADDFRPGLAVAIDKAEPLADRILTGPVPCGHRLVDHGRRAACSPCRSPGCHGL